MATIGQLLFLNGGYPSRLSSTDNADISGNLDLSGALWVKGELDVSGAAAFSGAISAVSLALSSDLDVSGNADISGALAVTGASTFTGAISGSSMALSSDLDVSGNTDISGNLAVTGTSAHTGAATFASTVDISGALDVSGAVSLSSTLDVSGASTLHGAATLYSTLAVSQDATFGADVQVNGDLSVNGKIISREQVDVIIKDTYLDLAFGNSTAGTQTVASQSGGFTVGQARNTNFAAGNVTAFPSSTTFTYADAGSSSLLAAGDVVVITGLPSEFAENEGYFVVASVSGASFPQTVTIENALQSSLPWAQTSFTAGSPGSAGQGYKPNLSVLAIADGTSAFKSGAGAAWPVGTLVLASYIGASAGGATKTLFQANGAYVAVGAGSTTLQNAYDNGNQITTASGDGNVIIAGDQALLVTATGGVDISGAMLQVNGSNGVEFGTGSAIDHFSVEASDVITFEAAGASYWNVVGGSLNFTSDTSSALTAPSILLNTTTLDVSGAAEFSSTVDISGALTADGAAQLNSTLGVSGAADFASTVDISGALAVDGAATFASTVDISGAADISGALAVTGAADFASTVDISGALAVDGAATFASTVDISGAADISGALAVTGAVSLASTLDVSGALTADGAAQLNSTLDVSGAASFASTADISGALTADGAVDFNSTLDVQGHAEFQSSVDISGALTVDGQIVADQMEVVSLGVECTAGEALSAGHIVALNGGTKQVVKALADDAVAVPLRRGWAVSRDAVSSAAQGYMIIDGFATVLFEGSATGSAGAPVFLSAATAGTATLQAPSAAGNAVMQIGYLAQDVSAAASGLIALEKQFIAQIPA